VTVIKYQTYAKIEHYVAVDSDLCLDLYMDAEVYVEKMQDRLPFWLISGCLADALL